MIFFHISAQNIDCGYSLEPPRRGGSVEYPQSMFLSRNQKKILYTLVNPSFTISKWGLRGSTLHRCEKQAATKLILVCILLMLVNFSHASLAVYDIFIYLEKKKKHLQETLREN